jgi:hypothetical protein
MALAKQQQHRAEGRAYDHHARKRNGLAGGETVQENQQRNEDAAAANASCVTLATKKRQFVVGEHTSRGEQATNANHHNQDAIPIAQRKQALVVAACSITQTVSMANLREHMPPATHTRSLPRGAQSSSVVQLLNSYVKIMYQTSALYNNTRNCSRLPAGSVDADVDVPTLH